MAAAVKLTRLSVRIPGIRRMSTTADISSVKNPDLKISLNEKVGEINKNIFISCNVKIEHL